MELCFSQPFLAKLQPLIKEENTTVGEAEKTETGNKNEVNAKFPISDLQEEEKHKDCDLGDVKKTQIHADPEVVQIKAGKAEVRRFFWGEGRGIIFLNLKLELLKHASLLFVDWQTNICIYWKKASWNQWKQREGILQCYWL